LFEIEALLSLLQGIPCSDCERAHDSDTCLDRDFICPDCNLNHPPFDGGCPIFQKYKIINYVMAYCNINQFNAKKLVKIRNITSPDQVERNFKSSPYLAWNNIEYTQKNGERSRCLIPSSTLNLERNYKRRRKVHRDSNMSTSDSGQMLSGNKMDFTLIPATNSNSIVTVI